MIYEIREIMLGGRWRDKGEYARDKIGLKILCFTDQSREWERRSTASDGSMITQLIVGLTLREINFYLFCTSFASSTRLINLSSLEHLTLEEIFVIKPIYDFFSVMLSPYIRPYISSTYTQLMHNMPAPRHPPLSCRSGNLFFR
jgi:hypothetical protein